MCHSAVLMRCLARQYQDVAHRLESLLKRLPSRKGRKGTLRYDNYKRKRERKYKAQNVHSASLFSQRLISLGQSKAVDSIHNLSSLFFTISKSCSSE